MNYNDESLSSLSEDTLKELESKLEKDIETSFKYWKTISNLGLDDNESYCWKVTTLVTCLKQVRKYLLISITDTF